MKILKSNEKEILEFNEKDLEQLHNWIKKWDEWRREKKVGLPDYTRDTIYLLPLTIALLKSEHRLSKSTDVLIILTIILAIETLVLIVGV